MYKDFKKESNNGWMDVLAEKQGVCSDSTQHHCYILHNHPYISSSENKHYAN